MFTLHGSAMRFAINELGQVCSCYNRLTSHEYVYQPGDLWKLIYAEGERGEIPIFATGQQFVAVPDETDAGEERLTLIYDGLQGDGRHLDVILKLTFVMSADRMQVTSAIENRDNAQIMEFQLTAASGLRSLSGQPQQDYLVWPADLGRKIPNPAFSDLSVYAGFRKYERHDQFHTDMDGLYPGRMSMQWYDWCNELEGLYVGSHDPSHQTTGLHIERDVKLNILRMGIIRYPMLEKGESWTSAPTIYAPHAGDWHQGARIYRQWIENACWHKPDQPEWIKQFKGWLRVILKQHHCEINWDYSQIPALYDEAAAAGMDTIFLLGWEKGGFARMWPDYVLDERMGGESTLRAGIDYVHGKGGKVLMFLSYALLDHESDYYKNGPGSQTTMKSLWGQEIPFSETYCGEGTWRKLGNPPMPMYLSCAGSPEWQDKMIESAKYCLDLGADGVLYDLGGLPAYFCFDKSHTHAKPSHSCCEKANNYKGLHDYIRSRGRDKVILMEHNVDIFAQHMDISQGSVTHPNRGQLLEMYRYTFPEQIMTNRDCGQDEVHYLQDANYSFVYGLRFDMTVYRCCGTLSDIPTYAAYLKQINAIRAQYSDYLLKGRFVDNEEFQIDNPAIIAKAYAAGNGQIAVTLWNPSAAPQAYCLTNAAGVVKKGELVPEGIAVEVMI